MCELKLSLSSQTIMDGMWTCWSFTVRPIIYVNFKLKLSLSSQTGMAHFIILFFVWTEWTYIMIIHQDMCDKVYMCTVFYHRQYFFFVWTECTFIKMTHTLYKQYMCTVFFYHRQYFLFVWTECTYVNITCTVYKLNTKFSLWT